jgi:hypothetical protein
MDALMQCVTWGALALVHTWATLPRMLDAMADWAGLHLGAANIPGVRTAQGFVKWWQRALPTTITIYLFSSGSVCAILELLVPVFSLVSVLLADSR